MGEYDRELGALTQAVHEQHEMCGETRAVICARIDDLYACVKGRNGSPGLVTDVTALKQEWADRRWLRRLLVLETFALTVGLIIGVILWALDKV